MQHCFLTFPRSAVGARTASVRVRVGPGPWATEPPVSDSEMTHWQSLRVPGRVRVGVQVQFFHPDGRRRARRRAGPRRPTLSDYSVTP